MYVYYIIKKFNILKLPIYLKVNLAIKTTFYHITKTGSSGELFICES